MCPPERVIICTRWKRHARPTFSTPASGQYTTYVIANSGILIAHRR